LSLRSRSLFQRARKAMKIHRNRWYAKMKGRISRRSASFIRASTVSLCVLGRTRRHEWRSRRHLRMAGAHRKLGRCPPLDEVRSMLAASGHLASHAPRPSARGTRPWTIRRTRLASARSPATCARYRPAFARRRAACARRFAARYHLRKPITPLSRSSTVAGFHHQRYTAPRLLRLGLF
jgi:hypothetical protein